MKTKSQHTPGPWTQGINRWQIWADPAKHICSMSGVITYEFGKDFLDDEANANARLIAASPLLYEVAKEAIEAIKGGYYLNALDILLAVVAVVEKE